MHIVISFKFVVLLLVVAYFWGGVLFVKRNCQDCTALEKISFLFTWMLSVFCSMNHDEHQGVI